MASLAVETWLRFLVWLLIGLVVYFVYGRTHSRLAPGRSGAAVEEELGEGESRLIRRLHSLGASAKNAVGTLRARVTRTAPPPWPSESRSEGAGGKGPSGQPGPSVAGDDAATHS